MLELEKEKVGDFLYELRKCQKISQAALADELLVSVKTVYNWEKGISMPSMEDAVRICNYYGLELSELFAGQKSDASGSRSSGGSHDDFSKQKDETTAANNETIHDEQSVNISANALWIIILMIHILAGLLLVNNALFFNQSPGNAKALINLMTSLLTVGYIITLLKFIKLVMKSRKHRIFELIYLLVMASSSFSYLILSRNLGVVASYNGVDKTRLVIQRLLLGPLQGLVITTKSGNTINVIACVMLMLVIGYYCFQNHIIFGKEIKKEEIS